MELAIAIVAVVLYLVIGILVTIEFHLRFGEKDALLFAIWRKHRLSRNEPPDEI